MMTPPTAARLMIRSLGQMLKLCTALIASMSYLSLASTSDAGLLNLRLGRPDINVGLVGISYDPGNDKFVATGVVASLDYDGQSPWDYISPAGINATFQIKAKIGDNGVIGAPSGSYLNQLVITGTVPGKGITTSQVLLKADLVSVGADSTKIEMRFANVTGALAADFKAPLGMILSNLARSNVTNLSFDGNFTRAYSNLAGTGPYGTAAADIAPEVPEPASLVAWSLTATSLFALRGYKFRRRSKIAA